VKKNHRPARAAFDHIDARSFDDERSGRGGGRLQHFLSKAFQSLFNLGALFYHGKPALPLHAASMRRGAGDQEMTDGVTVENGVAYANHDSIELVGDLYLPQAAKYLPKPAKGSPALVAVHGGGWVAGVRSAFQYWGPYLAARGIAVFAISYRLATKSKTFPEAVQDVLAGVQFVRGKAHAFGIDPARIGLLGASAGAHLAALAALSGKKFTAGYPQDPFAATDSSVKALIGVYGVYDLNAM